MLRSQLIALAIYVTVVAAAAAPSKAVDPCAKVANVTFAKPADWRACYNSFPFNETIRDNVIAVHERVFNFYTFEDYYLNSPPPFQESTTNIRAQLARIASTKYSSDYAFNRDLYDFTTQLNDGHTRWFPNCYTIGQNIAPIPVISLSTTSDESSPQALFVAPDSVALLSGLGPAFTDFMQSQGLDYTTLQGAKIISIEGQDPYAYVDHIASTVSGNYLDHGVRVNSVFTSYRIVNATLSQRVGDLAGPVLPDLDSVTMVVEKVGSTKQETVTVPYAFSYEGPPFTDGADYWTTNCAANAATNGVDLLSGATHPLINAPSDIPRGRIAKANIITPDSRAPSNGLNLPPPFVPTVPVVAGGEGVILSYILDDKKTGVMFVGSFEPDETLPGFGFPQFENDVVDSINTFKKAGVSQVLIDLSNNGGGFVCLGQFLHQYLAGNNSGYPGFVSTQRGNALAQKIVAENAKLSLNITNYSPLNWAFLNDTEFPANYNYDQPLDPFVINGIEDPTSQRFHDICTPFNVTIPAEPPFPLNKLAIIGNANCASTCAMFSTLMVERQGVTTAVWGGKPGETLEYKGMAGNQVLEWADIDTEIKTAQLKDDPLAPPDLLVNGDFRHNWRTAWSFFNEEKPIAYVSEPAKFRFAYTNETYNQPQKLWEFAASKLF